MKTKMSFSEFIYKNFKSFSHGHDWHHEEVNGLFYNRNDYDKAVEQYDDYQFKLFLGGQNEKSNELARGTIKRDCRR